MRRVNGFTLLELLITITIAAILVSLVVPFSQQLLIRNRASSDIQQMVRRLHLVRIAAIKSGVPVTFCGSDDRKHCGGNWRAGQIAFIDHDGDHQLAGEDVLLQSFGPLAEQAHLQWRGFRSRDYIILEPSGIAKASSGHFAYRYADLMRKIIINRTGRLRVE